MIFIGFGFLMTFLSRHMYSSVGLNFLVAALAAQWAMLVVPVTKNLFHGHSAFDGVTLDVPMLIEGDFAAAAVLITFGGLLGKVGPLQLLVIAMVEVVVYAIDFQVVTAIGMLD